MSVIDFQFIVTEFERHISMAQNLVNRGSFQQARTELAHAFGIHLILRHWNEKHGLLKSEAELYYDDYRKYMELLEQCESRLSDEEG